MKRRTVLALIGGTGGIGGCISIGQSDSPPASASQEPPATPRSTPPVNTGGIEIFDPATTYKEIDVGNRIGVNDDFEPHNLRIWNAVSGHREVNLRILDRLASATDHQAGYTIPADDALVVTLLDPARYYVQIWGPDIDTETLQVPCSLFDCNASETRIKISADGTVKSSVISTLVGCPSPDC